MVNTLTFVHTSPVHINTFNTLIQEIEPDIPVRHIVDVGLLEEAMATEKMTPTLKQRVTNLLIDSANDRSNVVVCTCSTIGVCTEEAAILAHNPVMRIDQPMAEKAVALGSRIVLVAALSSTLQPTRMLLEKAGQTANKPITIVDILSEGAWERFEAGDKQGYLQTVAATLDQAATQGDVVILAQASMAGAVDLCPALPVPVLSSPRLGVEAAIAAYHIVAQAQQ